MLFDGSAKVERKGGHWATSGDARMIGLDAGGPALSGDRLRLESVAAAWDVEQTLKAWDVRQAKVTSPVGELLAKGVVGGEGVGPDARLEASVDLSAPRQVIQSPGGYNAAAAATLSS